MYHIYFNSKAHKSRILCHRFTLQEIGRVTYETGSGGRQLFYTGCVFQVRWASVKTNPLTQREGERDRSSRKIIPLAAGVTMALKTCCIYTTGVVSILVLIAGIALDLSGVFPNVIQSLVKEVSALVFSAEPFRNGAKGANSANLVRTSGRLRTVFLLSRVRDGFHAKRRDRRSERCTWGLFSQFSRLVVDLVHPN